MKKSYVPASLSASDKKKQIKSVKQGTPRPKVAYKARQFDKKIWDKYKT